jgi:hypothetical protein
VTSGGTPALDHPRPEFSGGVAGPRARERARAAQQPPDEQPPQVQPPPETTPEEEPAGTPDKEAAEAPGAAAPAPGAGGGGGLPSTGLEVAALVAIGVGLLLAGLALRSAPRTRRPTSARR